MIDSVIAVHDLSCFGRCSLTVVLPVISSCGINCAVLPTALLSTHTGGFEKPVYTDLSSNIYPIYQRWRQEGLNFKGIYTGYLGCSKQPEILIPMFKELSQGGAKIFVDPVMGDNGRLYSSIDPSLIEGMRKMVGVADIAMPNVTEACLLLDIPYREAPHDEEFVDSLLNGLISLGAKTAVVTGISRSVETVSVCYIDETGNKGSHQNKKIAGNFHGSGDMFGSVLVGKTMTGSPLGESVAMAADFVAEVIASHICDMEQNPTPARNGLSFEKELWRLQKGFNSFG